MAAVTIEDLLKDDGDDTDKVPAGSLAGNPTGVDLTPASKNKVVPGWPTSDDETEAKKLSEQDKFLRKYGITGTLDSRFKDMLDAQEKQREEEIRLTQQNKQDREASLAAIKKLQQPNLPTLKDIPSAPPSDAYQFQNPFLAFQNPGVFLALMASFATRTPLTAAFNSAAAAMKGFHEGDKQAIDQNVAHWKDSVEQAIQQNKVETQKYTELWNKYHDNYEKLLAEMQAHAAGYKDDMMLAQLRYAGPKETYELIEHRIQAGEQLELSFAHVEEAKAKADEAHTRAQLYATADFRPEDVDLGVKLMLKGATFQEAFPGIGRTPQGEAKRSLIMREFTRQAAEEGLTPEKILELRNQRAAAKAATVAGARVGATQGANLQLIARNLEKAIPAAEQASDAVPRWGSVRAVNAITQAAASAISDTKMRTFALANLQVAELWARAMNPKGVMRESDRLKALEILNTTESKQTYKVLLGKIRDFAQREIEAAKEEMAGFTGKTDAIAAEAQKAAGVTPETAAPPTATEPDKSGWLDIGNGIRIKPAEETTPAAPAEEPVITPGL